MTSPLVSIIVLNLNGASIIRRCLDHLLAQTYAHFEIIVVDNGSSDGSLAILEEYVATGKVSVIRSKKNAGVYGGRNLGLHYARGGIVAFIDNDGYASPTWLAEAVGTLESDGQIGAIASVVFFNKRKVVLNGAGGTINYQGFGGDFCFQTPYEFADPPSEVLFPMGCGMVIRKDVMDRIGPFDPLPVKWYDDVELGIRVWKLGFKVVVSPNAWVDHDMGHSDEFLPSKVYLCERARIRTALKYYPAHRLLWWLLHEPYILRHLRTPALWSIPIKSWGWNLVHLASALAWRVKFLRYRKPFWHLLDPSWGSYPPPRPNTLEYRPDASRTGNCLILDGVDDRHQLNFGWYFVEQDGPIDYRWTEARASAFVNLPDSVRFMSIRFRSPRAAQLISVVVRRIGDLEPVKRVCIDPIGHAWQEMAFECSLKAGYYELLLFIDGIIRDPMGRTLGLAVNSIEFE